MPVSNRKSSLVPYWKSECGRAAVYLGDCRDVMAHMEPEQFHAVVTDPPYNLIQDGLHLRSMKRNGDGTDRTQQDNYKAGGFMNQDWDGTGVPFQSEVWEQVLHLAKPGAHLLSFGGTRTYHRMVCAIEDAEWEIRDCIMWVYSQGFPKSKDISKAIDKALGVERDKVRTPVSPDGSVWMDAIGANRPWKDKAKEVGYHEHDGGEPVTDSAKQWDGWGTALKPSYEPLVWAKKPFQGTVERNVMEHSCGGINVNGCRVGTDTRINPPGSTNPRIAMGNGWRNDAQSKARVGRWPANLIHDGSDEVVELFPTSSSSSAVMPLPKTPRDSNGSDHGSGFDDSGSAARFFYTAKADDDDRPHGKGKHVTTHPTVKPLDLMRYLVRLICAPGGVVFDPFMGSGSTGCAALLEGMWFVGIEKEQKYADIAVGRLKLALQSAPPSEKIVVGMQSEGGIPPVPRRLRTER